MQYRKLIKSGPSSFSVTIPSDWVKDNSLQKGDDLFLEVHTNYIKILADSNQENEEEIKEFLIDSKELYLIREKLKTYFFENYSRGIIKLYDELQSEEIVEIIESMPGFVYNIELNKILVENKLDLSEIDPKKEFNHIRNGIIVVLKNLCDKEGYKKQNIIFYLKGLKKRLYISISSINRLIDSPLSVNKFGLSLKNLINLKVKLKELPYAINSVLKIIKNAEFVNNFSSNLEIIKQLIEIVDSKLDYEYKKLKLKSLIEKIDRIVSNSQNVSEVLLLNEIKSFIRSNLRF